MMKLKQISGLGTAAAHNTGTTAGCVVKLEGSGANGALPAVDGSQLINLPTSGGGSETSIPLVNIITPPGGQDYTVPNSTPSGSLIVMQTQSDTANTNVYVPAASNYSAGEYLTIGREISAGAVWTYIRLATGDTWVNSTGTTQAINSNDSMMILSDGSSGWYKVFGGGTS
jgi:hypothetical protein